MSVDAICIGELLIDFTPEKEPRVYRQNPGGAPANVAVAMARTGLRVGFIGKVGKDAFGDFLLNTLRGEGVEILVPGRAEQAVTTMAFVSHDENGEREFTFVRKPGADMLLSPADVDGAGLEGATMLIGGSVSLSGPPSRDAVAHAFARAHALGKITSFDVNYRDMLWNGRREEARACILGLLKDVELLKMSDEEVELLCCGTDIDGLMREYGLRAVVVTHGAGGAHCYMDGERRAMPTQARKVVDATGAGDAFWGNTMGHLLRSGVKRAEEITMERLCEAVTWGNLAGGHCVGCMGGIPGMPTLEQLRAMRG